MDQMVLKTQQWLNSTYKGKTGYETITENGNTGWGTMYALIRALQIELGISTPNGSFGPATSAAFGQLSYGSSKTNQVYILQGALFCKGYNPGGFTGTFGDNTKAAVIKLQRDAGLTNADGVVNALLMKSLLTMDAFVLLNYGDYHGDANIRIIQQNLNRDYSSNQYFASDIGLVPCDGIYGRSTNKALLYALQIEEGVAVPNGVFGPTTKSLCPVLSVGSSKKKFILLLQYALYCNGYNPNGFDGAYGNGVKTAVTNFQNFCALTADGIAGMQTWASLLVSTGDTTRKGTMCDCSTTITSANAATLKSFGYKVVGRYLGGRYKMTSSELKTIFDNGLRVVPIYEIGGYKLSYFNESQGIADAHASMLLATSLGFGRDTIIYFAVDFDALDGDVTSSILPYFKGLKKTFNDCGNKYKIGIYAPRNVCTRVANAGYSCSSFVCDMSTGFSGNLGYPLPRDWAFDQISTVTLKGAADIEIDNNIASGRDSGVNSITPTIDLVKAANENSFAKLLSVEFASPDAKVILVSTGLIEISLGLSMKSTVGSGDNTIKFKDGGFDGFQTALQNIQEGLSKDGSLELATTLAKLKNMELSIKVASDGDNLKIELENSFNVDLPTDVSEKMTLSETLTIEFRVDGDKIKEEVTAAVDSVCAAVKEHPAITIIAIVAVIAAIIFLAADLSVGAIIAGIFDGIASIVIFIVSLLSQLIPKLA